MVPIVATLADDVSMSKITFDLDQAAVAAEVLDLDPRRAVYIEPVAPLDHDRPLQGQLFQPQVAQLRLALDPIKVDVRQLEAARVDADQLKGRAGNRRHRARAHRYAADEGCLPGSQLAGQEHDIAGEKTLAEQHARAFCFGRGAGDLLTQNGRSPCFEAWRR